MAQANVERCGTLYTLLDQGDDAVWDLVSPEFVLDFSRRLIDPTVLNGRDEARAFYEREWRDTWEDGIRWKPEELIDAGEKVLAFVWTSVRGKASGVQVEVRVWNMWTFRDGMPVEWKYFGEDRAAALEAAGLEKSDHRS